MLSVRFITTAASTPAHATTDPIDKSKSPAARQNNIVHETMPVIETARGSPRMFATEKKFSTKTEQPTKSSASTSNIPALSKNSATGLWEGGEESVAVAMSR